jgi:PAS domain S-box-containing protein
MERESQMHEMLDAAAYMAHGYCLLWKPWLVGLHVVSDILIAGAYFAIPVAIWIFLKKRPTLPLQNLAWLFVAFILLCGVTHLINLVTLWWPIYETQGVVKLATALVSVATAVAIFPLIPKALAIPSPAELEAVNARLTNEVKSHLETLRQLQAAKETLRAQFNNQQNELDKTQALLKAVNENTPTFIYAKDNSGALVFANAAVLQSLSRRPEEVLGRTDVDFLQDQEQARIIMKTDAEVRDTRITKTIEEAVTVLDGSTRIFLSTKTPHVSASGAVVGMIGVSVDITDRKKLEQDLATSEERLRLGSEAARFGTYDFYPSTNQLVWSDQLRTIMQVTPQADVTPELFFNIVHPDDRAEVAKFVKSTIVSPQGNSFHEQEYRVILQGGEVRWLLDRGTSQWATAPVRKIERVTGAVVDITELKLAQQRSALLTNELLHRGRNQMAVIASIANRSLSGQRSLDEGREVFVKRLMAISRSMDALTTTGLEAGELSAIVRSELESLLDRVDMKGPVVTLGARATQNFALAVHELATNAIKYGSLSVASGRVAVNWEILTRSTGPVLKFSWKETGGPPAVSPTREGFGTIIIKHNIAQEFKANVHLDYTEQGLTYEFEVDLQVIKPDDLAASPMSFA